MALTAEEKKQIGDAIQHAVKSIEALVRSIDRPEQPDPAAGDVVQLLPLLIDAARPGGQPLPPGWEMSALYRALLAELQRSRAVAADLRARMSALEARLPAPAAKARIPEL